MTLEKYGRGMEGILFLAIINFFRGYVKIRLRGYGPERFFNLCAKNQIRIWELEYHVDSYEFYICVSDFFSLKAYLKKTKTKVQVLERRGLPFFFHRYRKRKLFFGGIFLGLALLYGLSLFIWNIEVEGNLHRTDSAILKFLEVNQVRHGVLKSKLDSPALEELLRSEFDDIIWASVKIQGTKLRIDLQENLITNELEEAEETEEPSDLVAEKDGEIQSIFTRKGTPLVEKGATFVAGDVLVEGKIPILSDFGEVISYQYDVADADILAVTTYLYENSFPLAYEDKVFTGQEKRFFQLKIFQQQIRFYIRKNKFQDFDVFVAEHPLKLGENFYLPFIFCQEIAKEYQILQKKHTKEEAKFLAEQEIEKFCEKLSKKGVQILEKNVIIVTTDSVCLAKGEIKVVEPIGKSAKAEIVNITEETEVPNQNEFSGTGD